MGRNQKGISVIEVVSILVLIGIAWVVYQRHFTIQVEAEPPRVSTQTPSAAQPVETKKLEGINEVTQKPVQDLSQPKNSNHFGFIIGIDTYDGVISKLQTMNVDIKRTTTDNRPALALFNYKPFDDLTKSRGEKVIEMGQGSRGAMLVFNEDDKRLVAMHIVFTEKHSPPTVFPILMVQLMEKYGVPRNSDHNQIKKTNLYVNGNEIIILVNEMVDLDKYTTSLSYQDSKYYFNSIEESNKARKANINPGL